MPDPFPPSGPAERSARRGLTSILAAAAFLAGACGYHLVGRGGSFPAGVRNIAVASFKNRTERYGLEGEVAAAFVQRVLSTGKVKMISLPEADAWFDGVITGYETKPMAYTSKREVTERRVVITAKVEFHVKGEAASFYTGEGLTGRADYTVIGELSQDADAERRATGEALTDLADNVISRVLEGF